MYLNVLLLSDIALPNGKYIDMAAYKGDRDALHSLDARHCVNQTRPDDKAWADWKQCMHLFCHQDMQHMLHKPLGARTIPSSKYSRQLALSTPCKKIPSFITRH